MTGHLIVQESLADQPSGLVVLPLVYEAAQTETKWAVPHRHDFYSCILAEQGKLDLRLDFQPVCLTAPTLLMTCPGQVHQIYQPVSFKGWMLLAEGRLIDSAIRAYVDQAVANPALVGLTATEGQWFTQLFSSLQVTTDALDNSLYHLETSYALLNGCLRQAVNVLKSRRLLLPGYSRHGLTLTRRFRHLLAHHFLTHKKPADYASKLHVTSGHLNDTVKSVTGFSVSYYIQQETLTEAQRLLVYTDLTIQEIALHLGYQDSKYFSRLFKKKIGMSPIFFRHQHQSFRTS